jgi:uncharacterized protein YlxP (DUF503 family)
MHIGLLQIHLHLPGVISLKDKRHILSSLKDRIKLKTNVSVAEIEYLDAWQESLIAVVTVSNETNRVNQVLESVLKTVRDTQGAELTDYQIEML